jgi:hypothetical protein
MIVSSVFSAMNLLLCAEEAGQARIRCDWVAGGIAVGFAVASVPFFVLGKRQRRVASLASHVTIATAPRRAFVAVSASF